MHINASVIAKCKMKKSTVSVFTISFYLFSFKLAVNLLINTEVHYLCNFIISSLKKGNFNYLENIFIIYSYKFYWLSHKATSGIDWQQKSPGEDKHICIIKYDYN